jgi:hypothetical protein
MTCGRRFDLYAGVIPAHGDRREGQDRWQRFKSNGDRVCSYCGSLHPDDMFELVRQSATVPEDADVHSVVEIKPSDKGYKTYVHRPGIRNAHEGGIKFYHQHLPKNPDGTLAVTQVQQDEYAEAVRRSRVRFERMLYVKT